MTKVMFYGLPAWVGATHSSTVCDWWRVDPSTINWDRSLLYSVDLSLTPSAALAGRISVSQIDVDDFTANGGRTTIGPLWPSGNTIGACWVSDNYLSRAAAKARPGKPATADGHGYEYTAMQYFDGEQNNRRFYGFHARVLQVQGNLSLAEIWNPGTGSGTSPSAGTWWLDLAADADPNTPALVQGQPGALYLDATKVGQIALFEPKLPPYKGGFAFPQYAA
jgi:hypothetical protein